MDFKIVAKLTLTVQYQEPYPNQNCTTTNFSVSELHTRKIEDQFAVTGKA